MSLLSDGDRVTDTLTIEGPLGEGAFAEVHRVRHTFLGLQALKLFKRVASLEETHAMLDEARLLSTLGHPHIVRLFDANTVQTSDGVRGFFTMEYVPGGSLERLLNAYPRGVPLDITVEVIEQIADGLTLAHKQSPPILHRDLTLANVLVGYDGDRIRIRISDFGLAKRADPISMAASAKGTYAFMAPEVVEGGGHRAASDVWSVGTIAYLLLTNQFPYVDPSAVPSFSPARFRRPLMPPSRFNDGVDATLDRIVLAMLDVRPDRRPADASALTAILRERHRRLAPSAPATVLGAAAARARRLATDADACALTNDLPEAIRLAEEAMELDPSLRERYPAKLETWRRGVIM